MFLIWGLPAEGTPLASLGVGPDGPAGPGDPFYASAEVSVPERPHDGDPATHDCANAARPGEAAAWALATADDLVTALPDPMDLGSFNSAAALTPECLATPSEACTPVGVCPAFPAYAAYDVGEGRYYAEPGSVGPSASASASSGGVTGTLGAGFRDDCEDCPPPVCC